MTYAEALALLPPSALGIVDDLVSLAPPLAPSQKRAIQRALGHRVLPLPVQDPARMTRAQAAPHAA